MTEANKRRLLGFSTAWLAAGTAHADTMPQLDFANKQNAHLLVAQVVWGALIFTAFYLLVSRWGLPKVGAILEMRAGTIAGDLERARASKAEADQAVAELTASRRNAYAAGQASIAAATQRAKTAAAERAAEQDARLDAQLAASEVQIAQARSTAMGALREVSTDTAMALVSRLTSRHADEGRVHDEVGRILHERGLAP